MQFLRYDNMGTYRSCVLDVLLEHEVQNNLLLSLITNSKAYNAEDWLLASVTGNGGGVALTALYANPFPLLLYATGNSIDNDAVELLSRELLRLSCPPHGVMAESVLAQLFADIHAGGRKRRLHMATTAMRLDKLTEHEKAPGSCRALEKRDMAFAPFWERAFSKDCRSHVFSLSEYSERLKERLGKDTHFIWIDNAPVSQAVHGRDTPNGAVINMVYTPPQYRGHGYAQSVVSALSEKLLNSDKDFCCLYADSDNPVSCGMYKKLGFKVVGELKDIRFDI